ncbi:MAG: hypothetical protein AB8B56_19340 [Crocinitomicaceae bacterium]
MNFIKFLTPFSVFILLIATSCKKQGCTDPTANNYDYSAEQNDGSCVYDSTASTPTPPGNECTSGQTQIFFDVLAEENINCFDNTPGSPYQGQVFSLLKLTQNRFADCDNGYLVLNGYTENIIRFENITSNTVTFDYYINQNVNGSIRDYQGYVQDLAAGDFYEINTGDNTFYNVNYGVIQVTMNNISYQ